MYVWGWIPGIYVQAQRMSPTPKAFEGMMHTLPPAQLADRVQEILTAFEKNPPKFIVDTRKIHFPWTQAAFGIVAQLREWRPTSDQSASGQESTAEPSSADPQYPAERSDPARRSEQRSIPAVRCARRDQQA